MSSRVRHLVIAFVSAVLGVVLTAAALLVSAQSKRPELEPWHRKAPAGDFRAGNRIATLGQYRALETRLDGEVRTIVGTAPAEPYNRYRFSPTKQIQDATGGNRTFEIAAAHPRGVAVMFHGLSDAPYSLQPVGRVLAAQGYHVIALRLPGHGTVPAGLLDVRWLDWRAAAEMVIRDTSRRFPGAPIILVGYSNGAAIALDYTLRALDDRSLPRPQKLIFLSPALGVSGAAKLAHAVILLSRVPGLDRLAWNEILPEYDPFKYNSFTINAAVQVYGLTEEMESGLEALEAHNRLGELPPILTIQSVVDSTIPPVPSLSRVYGRIRGARNELVLFDVNREASAATMLRPGSDALLGYGSQRDLPFTVTVVTNANPSTREVIARTWTPESRTPTVAKTGLEWPDGVYSLSHVAIPFPPDDPAYGGIANASSSFPSLGRLDLRGESSLLRAPTDLLMRLRYNPFWPYVEERVAKFVE